VIKIAEIIHRDNGIAGVYFNGFKPQDKYIKEDVVQSFINDIDNDFWKRYTKDFNLGLYVLREDDKEPIPTFYAAALHALTGYSTHGLNNDMKDLVILAIEKSKNFRYFETITIYKPISKQHEKEINNSGRLLNGALDLHGKLSLRRAMPHLFESIDPNWELTVNKKINKAIKDFLNIEGWEEKYKAVKYYKLC